MSRKSEERAERLAAALRENLRKRKAQKRKIKPMGEDQLATSAKPS